MKAEIHFSSLIRCRNASNHLSSEAHITVLSSSLLALPICEGGFHSLDQNGKQDLGDTFHLPKY